MAALLHFGVQLLPLIQECIDLILYLDVIFTQVLDFLGIFGRVFQLHRNTCQVSFQVGDAGFYLLETHLAMVIGQTRGRFRPRFRIWLHDFGFSNGCQLFSFLLGMILRVGALEYPQTVGILVDVPKLVARASIR